MAARRRRPSRRRLQVLATVVTLVVAASISWGYWQARSTPARESGQASALVAGPVSEIGPAERGDPVQLSGTTLTGAAFDLSSLRGSVAVINVWGSWCAPCRQEAPVLAQQSNRLKDQGVQFLGVDVQDNRPAALAFERRYGISYPSIDDTDGKALLALVGHVPARAVPVTLVLDSRGRVAGRVVGAVDESTLSGLIDSARVNG